LVAELRKIKKNTSQKNRNEGVIVYVVYWRCNSCNDYIFIKTYEKKLLKKILNARRGSGRGLF
jgi:coenzyme F420-reducing hydrogenase beta subunit